MITQNMIRGILRDATLNCPAEEDSVRRFELDSGLTLPLDYVEFLKTANGCEGPVGSESYLVLWRIEEISQLNRDYHAGTDAPGVLLIGTDGGGEGYGFLMSDVNKPVVQVPFIGMSLECAEQVAPSFGEFLEVLGSA